MIKTIRPAAALPLCTTMALLASPALAHDGVHQMTYLQSLLHEMAHADVLATVACAAALAATAAWRLSRRRAARAKL